MTDPLREIDARLLNWGRYVSGGLRPPQSGGVSLHPDPIDHQDAALVEWHLSKLQCCSPLAECMVFVLKMHYAERWAPIEQRAKDMRRRFGVGSPRTYYRRLKDAQDAMTVILPEVGESVERIEQRLRRVA